jgi:hypothetical protein
MAETVYTLVLHHPSRPVGCLVRTLTALERATNKPGHIVHVIVQGDVKDPYSRGYPRTNQHYDLRYSWLNQNIGIGAGFRLAVERFLATEASWLAKVDDDIAVARRGWDILSGIVEHERAGGRKLGSVMMSTHRTKPRLLKKGFSENKIPLVTPVDGFHCDLHARICGLNVRWWVTDFSDIGCTVYNRELFESGCIPDDKLRVGGIGLDLVFQGNEKGFEWAVCGQPRCEHFGNVCSNKEYRDVRANIKTYAASHDWFYSKWGVVPIPLARVAKKITKGGIVIV